MKNSFDSIINLYDRARPGYPQELFEDIIAYSNIHSSSSLLEVGAGTGQATTFFASCGYEITVLEIGEKIVSYLAEKYKVYPNVSVLKTSFEDFSSDIKYDLLIAASSFHWIDREIRYKKAYGILNNGGALAQFWHMHPVQRFQEGIFSEINKVYDRYLKDIKFYEAAELNELIEKRIRQLTSCGFEEISFCEYKYEHTYSAQEYMELLSTYSYVRALDEEKESFLQEIYKCIEESGGIIHIPALVHLYLAKKGA